MKVIQRLVSGNKKRFVEDGIDLDLSYIFDNIIAMGFPAEKIEATYRNPMDEVLLFLSRKHNNHYRIYNLCQEKLYDPRKFGDNVVESFPFLDHNPPPFEMITQFCINVEKWLESDEKNVVVIHCKAGKGRTGTMICCYMLHANIFPDYQSCLKLYAEKRTNNSKGVTIPSQIRYVKYYQKYLEHIRQGGDEKLFKKNSITLLKISCENCFTNNKQTAYLLCIYQHDEPIYFSTYVFPNKTSGLLQFFLPKKIHVQGDFKIEITTKGSFEKNKKFNIWLNSWFLPSDSTQCEESDLNYLSCEPKTNSTITLPMIKTENINDRPDGLKNRAASTRSYDEDKLENSTHPQMNCNVKEEKQETDFKNQTFYVSSYRRDDIDSLHKKYRHIYPKNFVLNLYYTIFEHKVNQTLPDEEAAVLDDSDSLEHIADSGCIQCEDLSSVIYESE